MKINWPFQWFKPFYFLYIFGFFLHFRPSAPFLFAYLTREINLDEDTVNSVIFPIIYYSSAPTFFILIFITDSFGYNPFITIASLGGIVTIALYTWLDSYTGIVVAQVFNGFSIALELAYYVCIYAHTDVLNYQKVTSFVRVAPLLGKAISALLGQLIIWQNWLNYKELHYLDLATCIIAVVLSIFLSRVPDNFENNKSKFLSNLFDSFPNKFVWKWTIWSIVTVSIYNQIPVYIQPLWQFLQNKKNIWIFNGALEGVFAIFAIVATILGGFANFDWKFKGDLILTVASFMLSFMLLLVSKIDHILLNCVYYCIFGFIYHLIMTILSGEVAKFLKKGCFGLLFGIIAFIGALLSAAMASYLNNSPFYFNTQDCFLFYGFYNLVIALAFIIVGLVYWFAKNTYPI